MGLKEVYLPMGLEETPPVSDGDIQWTWWPWSEQTGSDWPDDDAIYRASNRNLTLIQTPAPPLSNTTSSTRR